MLIKLIQIRFDPIRIRIDSIRFKFKFDSIRFDQFESMNFMIRLDSTSNRFANQISNQIFFGTLTLMRHAFIYFASEDDIITVNTGHDFVYKNQQLFWSSPMQKTCHNCSDFTHLIKDCKEKHQPPSRRPLYLLYDIQVFNNVLGILLLILNHILPLQKIDRKS